MFPRMSTLIPIDLFPRSLRDLGGVQQTVPLCADVREAAELCHGFHLALPFPQGAQQGVNAMGYSC
jgi:hypothetical protein